MVLRRAFQILDTSILLTGPAAPLHPIATAYSRFAVPEEQLEAPLRIEVNESCDRMWVGGCEQHIDSELDSTFQIYQEFLALVLQNVGSHAVLHGAALRNHHEGCFLISAPSGHGKSSLALALADRGYGFLGDDYAPLHLTERTIHPYPRAVSVLPGGSARIPLRFREAAENPDATCLFGKRLLDVGELLGESAQVKTAVPLRQVLLVSGGSAEEEPAETLLDVAARSVAADLIETRISEIGGVEIIESGDQGYLRRWVLRLSHDLYPTQQIAQLMDHEAIVHCEKRWTQEPVFDRPPQARRIKRREAAALLGRELLNRRNGGRLSSRYGGNVTEIFLDLAGALRDAECWRVQTGFFDDTIELVEKLIDSPTRV